MLEIIVGFILIVVFVAGAIAIGGPILSLWVLRDGWGNAKGGAKAGAILLTLIGYGLIVNGLMGDGVYIVNIWDFLAIVAPFFSTIVLWIAISKKDDGILR